MTTVMTAVLMCPKCVKVDQPLKMHLRKKGDVIKIDGMDHHIHVGVEVPYCVRCRNYWAPNQVRR